jgi:Cu2+-exporting ATPase
MNEIDTLIIDKTGTITEGKPSVEKVVSVSDEFSSHEILQYIISANQHSEHPLAEATMKFGKKENTSILPTSNFNAVTGKGVFARINKRMVALGNNRLMQDVGVQLTEGHFNSISKHQKDGKTVSLLSIDKDLKGYVVIGDAIKDSSREALKKLKDEGVNILMLTGDNKNTAAAVAQSLDINFKAEMLPENKLHEVERLQKEGHKVAMAGDGINDAPALAQSDVGIAMGTGTDVAIESAGITLVKGDLHGIVKARILSHKVMKNIKQNLFFALIYNTIGVPVAAGVLYPFFGILLSPMIAALAMSFSSVSVIGNALRLRYTNIS